ncbi:porin [Marinilabilia rubra]|uniref:Porin n=1 Tax=Marinilabilia rubra TaxID=2162893 RepID=A0A2U2BC77_9BACT|nr:porin [Marinilabilia rubra]PWE00637.1 porin [Marinilabilia rubra]
MFSVFRSIMLLIGVVLFCQFSNAQESSDNEFTPSGSVYGKIFTNFNTSIQGPEKQTAFEVRRAYLGYEYFISPEFAAEVKIDIGSPNDASQYSLLRRFGYFKTAAIYYTPMDNLEITVGLQGATQFKTQEKFWGRRYIKKSFMDIYKFGPSADIGVKAVWKSDFFDVDFALFNGEGYSSLQNDNTFKGALGFTAHPIDGLTTRIYGDLSSKIVTQGTTVLFAGYKTDKFSIGGEYAWHFNRNFQDNHNMEGFSIVGDVLILPKTHLFGRFDKADSNILKGESVPWNLARDETAVTAGIEFSPVKAIKIAANYQDNYPAAKNAEVVSAFYLNIQASF